MAGMATFAGHLVERPNSCIGSSAATTVSVAPDAARSVCLQLMDICRAQGLPVLPKVSRVLKSGRRPVAQWASPAQPYQSTALFIPEHAAMQRVHHQLDSLEALHEHCPLDIAAAATPTCSASLPPYTFTPFLSNRAHISTPSLLSTQRRSSTKFIAPQFL